VVDTAIAWLEQTSICMSVFCSCIVVSVQIFFEILLFARFARYVFGGVLRTGEACKELWTFKHSAQHWELIKEVFPGSLWPPERYGAALVVFPVLVTSSMTILFQRYAASISKFITDALMPDNSSITLVHRALAPIAFDSEQSRAVVDDFSYFLALFSGLNIDRTDILPDFWLYDCRSGLWTMPFTFATNTYEAIYAYGRRFSSMSFKYTSLHFLDGIFLPNIHRVFILAVMATSCCAEGKRPHRHS
jgi:hypothetical protein